ncbi:unnamed protein product [Symbiodinium sp. CCMP2456]|nr:unnamed protein product [Symbiodinium sp. CCMP2456]
MVLLLASVMLAVMTGVMLHAFRSVAVRSSGVLASPADESAFLGVGEAVDLCGLVDYPKLPAQDLHRIQDVAFSMALPGRGGVIKAATKAAAKAVAAKEFAAVSSKLKKSKSKETVAGEGKWYYMSDLRKMKVGADDPKAWTAYNGKMNKQLETAYSKGFKQYTMTLGDKQYIVKFNTMVQFRADDKSLQRPVKRE